MDGACHTAEMPEISFFSFILCSPESSDQTMTSKTRILVSKTMNLQIKMLSRLVRTFPQKVGKF